MSHHVFTNAEILVADDQLPSLQLLEAVFQQQGYTNIRTTSRPFDVIPLITERPTDLLLLDLHMPGLNGLEILDLISKKLPEENYLPVLVLTADTTTLTRERALEAGAHDYVTKPFNRKEVLLRARNLLHTRYLHLELQRHLRELEERIVERTKALEHANMEIVERLTHVATLRADESPDHIRRVGALSGLIAQELGINGEELQMLRQAAQLHDLGKSGISDRILLKTTTLTSDEHRILKTHTTIGAEILKGCESKLLQLAAEIALNHHEGYSGDGYPRGLRGQGIPLSARIVAVADVFDALTHDRPYKARWTAEQAIEEIKRMSGKQLDPTVVQAFLRVALHHRDLERTLLAA